MGRKAHIVLNDVSTSVQPLVDLFHNNPEYEEDMILNSQQAIEAAGNNTVLVVVDVNKPSITECPDLLRYCKSVVVLDHHRQGAETIENATLSYVEPMRLSSVKWFPRYCSILMTISKSARRKQTACIPAL